MSPMDVAILRRRGGMTPLSRSGEPRTFRARATGCARFALAISRAVSPHASQPEQPNSAAAKIAENLPPTGSRHRLSALWRGSLLPEPMANFGRQSWPCGAVAVAWLTNAALNKWVSCNALREKDGERLSRCSSSEHQDLAADTLREELAIVLPIAEGQEVRAYSALQDQARK